MGRKKRRNARKKAKQDKINEELKFVLGLILGIFFCLIIFGSTGALSKTLSPILSGIFGPIKYLLPVGVFYLTIYDIVKEEEISGRVKLFIVLLILICSILTISAISKHNVNMNVDTKILLEECFELGKKGVGGGATGAIVAIPAIKLMGITGATILLIFTSMFLSFLVLGKSVIDYYKDLNAKIAERKQNRTIRQAEARAKRYERIKENQDEINKIEKNIDKIEDKSEKGLFGLFTSRSKKIEAEDIDENQENEDEKELNISLPNETESYTKNLDENEFRPAVVKRVIPKANPNKEETKSSIQYVDLDIEYKFPSLDILDEPKSSSKTSKSQIEKTALGLQKTLLSFGVSAKVQNVTVGPAVTRYELKPAVGVKVNKIKNLADDIALSLAAPTIRIEAPIPGKRAVGIEVPNEKQASVSFKEVIDTPEFMENKSPIAFALGRGIDGKPVIADLDKMRHLLIAGATGSGKSVCINTIINSIIYHASPHEVKLIMVDPKVVELSNYNHIPHLSQAVVNDPEKAAAVLKWAVNQMTERYNEFANYKAKDIDSYNKKMEKTSPEKQIPRLVILVDELADLMMTAGKEVEDAICRIAQMGRAAGIHLIIATQRPSTDVITGLIKANIPSRIAFAVTSGMDSRIILDMQGAEKLLGKGDMLYYPMGATQPYRVQGAFISDGEIAKILEQVSLDKLPESRKQAEENFEKMHEPEEKEDIDTVDEDEYLFEAIDTILTYKQASKTFLRRKFSMGDLRAGRLIDRIEELGIIGPQISTKPREILVTQSQWDRMKVEYWPDLFVLEGQEDEYVPDEEVQEVPENKEIDYEKQEFKPQEVYYENGEEKIVREINKYQKTDEATNMLLNQVNMQKTTEINEVDPLLKVAVDTVMGKNEPTSEAIVEYLGINPSRADKLIKQMEDVGIIIKDQGINILNITPNEWDIMKQNF